MSAASRERGRWLRSTRESLGLSAKHLAIRTGLGASTLSNYERGAAPVPDAVYLDLRRVLLAIESRGRTMAPHGFERHGDAYIFRTSTGMHIVTPALAAAFCRRAFRTLPEAITYARNPSTSPSEPRSTYVGGTPMARRIAQDIRIHKARTGETA